ncbi:general transcription factor 3C polypeptide 1-like [Salvelinus fontinalis]|uniref:general transcription factor 3C polypeptide 1-like n=1 Tax=Salvelinus fontinalis TaxID=8038 RepID=UPI0024866CA8|nr:general transcription factor 3C polypeptide 1-like [Salvelinus fontinalis]
MNLVGFYVDELSWRRYIPPAPVHRDFGPGWALTSDVVLCLPLSIYIQIIQTSFKVDGLEEYLNDPVKQHYLIRFLPSRMKTQLLHKRKYIFSFHDSMQRLIYMGLLQFGPVEKFQDKDQVYLYVKRNCMIVDTTMCEPHYNLVLETRVFERRRYTLNTLTDVDNYWFDLMCVCLNTPLGVIRKERPKRSSASKSQEEPVRVPVDTDRHKFRHLDHMLKGSREVCYTAVIPGDSKGAGGLDSDFFGHLKRNWIWTCHLMRTKKSNNQYESSNTVRLNSLLTKHLAMDIGSKFPGPLSSEQEVPAGLRFEEVHISTEPSSRNRLVKGGKKQKKKRTVKEKKQVKTPRKKKKVEVRKRAAVHDAADHKALKMMTRRRVTWSVREDSVLILCRVASHFLNRKLRRPFVPWCVVRDLLHAEFDESLDKTSPSVGRRSRYILKNPQTYLNYKICLAEVYQDKPLIATLQGRKHDPNDPTECSTVFREFVSLLRQKFSSASGSCDVTIPDTKTQLFSRFKVYTLEDMSDENTKDSLNSIEDVHSLVLNNLIQSTLAMSNSQMKCCRSFQTFHTYSRYRQDVLCQVFVQCRKKGLVNRRRISQLCGPNKNRALPILPMSYQLSQSYYRCFTWRLPTGLCTEVFDFMQALSENGTGDNYPSTVFIHEGKEKEKREGMEKERGEEGMEKERGEEGMEKERGEDCMEKEMGEEGMEKERGEEGMEKEMGEEGMEKEMGEEGMEKERGEEGMEKEMGEEGMEKEMGEEGMEKEMGEEGMEKEMGEEGMEKERGEEGMEKEMGEEGIEKERGEEGMEKERGEDCMEKERGMEGMEKERGEEGIEKERGEENIDKERGEEEREKDEDMETEERGKNTENETEERGKNTENETEERGKNTENETEERGKNTENETEERGKNTENETEERGKNTENETEERGKNTENETEERGKNTENETEERGKNTENETEERGKNTENETEERGKNTENETEERGKNTESEHNAPHNQNQAEEQVSSFTIHGVESTSRDPASGPLTQTEEPESATAPGLDPSLPLDLTETLQFPLESPEGATLPSLSLMTQGLQFPLESPEGATLPSLSLMTQGLQFPLESPEGATLPSLSLMTQGLQFPLESPGGATLACLSLMTLGLLSVHVSIPEHIVVLDSTMVDKDVVKSISVLAEDDDDEEESEGRRGIEVRAHKASHTKYLMMRGYCVPGIVNLRNLNTNDSIVVESCTMRLHLRHTPVHTLFITQDSPPIDFSRHGPSLLPSFLTHSLRAHSSSPLPSSVEVCEGRLVTQRGYSPEDIGAVAELRATLERHGAFGLDRRDLVTSHTHLVEPRDGRTRGLQQYLQDLLEEELVLEVGGSSVRLVLLSHAEPWLLTSTGRQRVRPHQAQRGASAFGDRKHHNPLLRKRRTVAPREMEPRSKRERRETLMEGEEVEKREEEEEERKKMQPEEKDRNETAEERREEAGEKEKKERVQEEPSSTTETEQSTEGDGEKPFSSLAEEEDGEASGLREEEDGSGGVCDVSFISRPWRIVDGSLNRPVCKGMLEAVLSHIMTRPGLPEHLLLEHYRGVLQPVVVLDLVQALVELGCIKKKYVTRRPKPSLFSRPAAFHTVEEERVGETGVRPAETTTVFYEPTIDCCLRLGQVLPHEKNWNQWVQFAQHENKPLRTGVETDLGSVH